MHLLTLNNLVCDIKIYDLLLYYIIYSFLGWCAEVCYAYKNQRKFVNRGFLHGPLCPIYGACILSLVILLNNFQGSLFTMLIIASILTSIVEYFTGLILEKLFKTKYWDYSDDPFNLHGRICLHFSIMWGAVCLLILKVIHPSIVSLVTLFPENIRIAFSIVFSSYLLVDFVSTLRSLINLKNVFYHLQLDGNSFTNKYPIHIYTHHLQNFFEDIKEKISNIIKNV